MTRDFCNRLQHLLILYPTFFEMLHQLLPCALFPVIVYKLISHMSQNYPYFTILLRLKCKTFKVRTVLKNDKENILKLYFLYRSEEHTSELQSRENLVCR